MDIAPWFSRCALTPCLAADLTGQAALHFIAVVVLPAQLVYDTTFYCGDSLFTLSVVCALLHGRRTNPVVFERCWSYLLIWELRVSSPGGGHVTSCFHLSSLLLQMVASSF